MHYTAAAVIIGHHSPVSYTHLYFEKVLTAVKKHLDRSNTVIGTYMCQGKMPQSVRERYVKMQASPLPIPNLDSLIENFDRAATHPDAEDLHRLTAAVKQTESR